MKSTASDAGFAESPVKKTTLSANGGGPQRLYSLDALRGFDMFWIMGGEEIVNTMYKANSGSGFWAGFANQLTHPAWNGFHMYDCIFPLFLFIAGVATPYSVGRELEKGKTKHDVTMRVIKRGFILVMLGLVTNNGLAAHVILPLLFITGFILAAQLSFRMMKSTIGAVAGTIVAGAILCFIYSSAIKSGSAAFQITDVRFGSVLGRIGMAYMFANIIYIYTKKQTTQIIWFLAMVIGYWLILKLTSAPGFTRGDLTQPGNFTSYVDRLFLPGKLYLGNHDPEGLLATIPAIGTGLLGIMTGNFLKNSPMGGAQKAIRMFVAGAILFGLAWVWNLDFPVNKNLWTSSFVLNVGGISLMFLSVFYYVIDVLGYKKWAFFFKIIGMNSILIYMSGHFIDWDYSTNGFFHWVGQILSDPYDAVAFAILYVCVKWAFLYFMYKKNVFLRV